MQAISAVLQVALHPNACPFHTGTYHTGTYHSCFAHIVIFWLTLFSALLVQHAQPVPDAVQALRRRMILHPHHCVALVAATL